MSAPLEPPPIPPPERQGLSRWFWRGLGGVMVAIAAVGVVTPILPTTPFLLVAVWAFAKGEPAWAEWLRRHPRFGPPLIAWEERQVIPWVGKIAAGVGMALGVWAAWMGSHNPWVAGGLAVVLAAVWAWIVTRPSR